MINIVFIAIKNEWWPWKYNLYNVCLFHMSSNKNVIDLSSSVRYIFIMQYATYLPTNTIWHNFYNLLLLILSFLLLLIFL